MKAPRPSDEVARLDALYQYDILDTPAEGVFDDLTRLAARICGVPIALVSFADKERHWFKSKVGVTASETSRDIAFCALAILQPDVFIVQDACQDARFANNPLVTSEPNIRFYAGVPLITSDNHALGTLCVIDGVARELSSEQAEALQMLARQVVTQLELRRDLLHQTTAVTEHRQGKEALLKSEGYFRLLVESVKNYAIFMLDPQGRVASWNAGAQSIKGYRAEEILGQHFSCFYPEEDIALAKPEQELHLCQAVGRIEDEGWRIRKDGSQFWANVVITALRDEAGSLCGFAKVTRDITERKQAEADLRQQLERERLVSEIAQHIRQSLSLEEILDTTVSDIRQFLACDRTFIYRFNPDWSGVVLVESVAPGWPSILGATVQDSYFVETTGQELYKQGRVQVTADTYTAGLSECHFDLLAQLQIRANLVVPILQEEHLWGLLVSNQCAIPRQWQQHEITLLKQLATHVGIAIQQAELYQQAKTELAERQRAEEQLLHNAFYDALTGLPNRALFLDRLRRVAERAKRRKRHLFAVLFLDVDRFKLVNDSLGREIGDQLLVVLAQRLEACLRPGDTVARLGGDEFAVLLDDIKNFSAATYISERIQAALTSSFNLSAQEVFITVSIGIALSSGAPGAAKLYKQPEDLLSDADIAMSRAKAQGQGHHQLFDPAMHEQAVARLQLETELRQAVERQEFQLHYQPIVSLATGKITGFEALVRWQHPTRGLLFPAEFIPMAEQTGLIIPIGSWVLQEACHQTRLWQVQSILGCRNGPSSATVPLSISVNLSVKQFSQPALVEEVEQILDNSGLEAHSLKLEITESLLVENAEAATALLLQLRALGVELQMDDFGTGYSSLSHLHRFPFNTLKIDRSFVSQLDTSEKNNSEAAPIVQTIVTLAHTLGMSVTAEGIETETQLAQLRVLGCNYGQGYIFSKPVDAKGAAAFLASKPKWLKKIQALEA